MDPSIGDNFEATIYKDKPDNILKPERTDINEESPSISKTVSQQIEIGSPNTIEYRTCTWQKVGDYNSNYTN